MYDKRPYEEVYMGFVDKIFGSKSEKEIRRIIKFVDAIEALDE